MAFAPLMRSGLCQARLLVLDFFGEINASVSPIVDLAGNVGVVSGIFPPQNDVGADMSAPCRRHDTDHVGDIAPCRLAHDDLPTCRRITGCRQ